MNVSIFKQKEFNERIGEDVFTYTIVFGDATEESNQKSADENSDIFEYIRGYQVLNPIRLFYTIRNAMDYYQYTAIDINTGGLFIMKGVSNSTMEFLMKIFEVLTDNISSNPAQKIRVFEENELSTIVDYYNILRLFQRDDFNKAINDYLFEKFIKYEVNLATLRGLGLIYKRSDNYFETLFL